MDGIGFILVIFILLILTGLFFLISGYNRIGNNEGGSEEFIRAKNSIKAGIVIFTLIGVVLIIGSSACLGML